MKNFIVLITSLCFYTATSQNGNIFPELEGENLAHDMVNIPEDVHGKHTLIGVALSKRSENLLKSWFDPVYQQLIKKPEEGSVFAFSYDVNIYFIPMLTGAKRPAYQKVMDKVEKDIDPKLHPYVLFYKGSLKEYKEALNINEKNIPYFYLLDKTGKIIYSTSGYYSDAKLQRIIDKLPFE